MWITNNTKTIITTTNVFTLGCYCRCQGGGLENIAQEERKVHCCGQCLHLQDIGILKHLHNYMWMGYTLPNTNIECFLTMLLWIRLLFLLSLFCPSYLLPVTSCIWEAATALFISLLWFQIELCFKSIKTSSGENWSLLSSYPQTWTAIRDTSRLPFSDYLKSM